MLLLKQCTFICGELTHACLLLRLLCSPAACCPAQVGGENQAAKRQQTQMEQLRTSMKERKQTTALTNTELAVATAESAFQLWNSGGEEETSSEVRNTTTEDCWQAEVSTAANACEFFCFLAPLSLRVQDTLRLAA